MNSGLLSLYRETDAVGLSALVRRKEVAPVELVDIAIGEIERLNPALNAVVHRLYDMARAAAEAVDTDAAFAGVPYLLKELASMCAGTPMTNGSAWMRHVRATADDAVVARLRSAGLIFIGKSNSPENGWSIATEPSLYGPTQNPWRAGVSPGGSSGGAAAAVAAGMVPLAEASDAAGSIRVPASCCGLVGLKPSRGRMTPSPAADPWQGSVYSFCVSRTVRDSAAFLDVVAGGLPGEPYTPPTPERSWSERAQIPPAKLTIGFTTTAPNRMPVHPEIARMVRDLAARLAGHGHAVEEFDLPLDGSRAWEAYARVAAVHNAGLITANAALVGALPTEADVEPVTWALYQRGRSTDALAYLADMEYLRALGRRLATALQRFDIYLTPTLIQPPRPIGYLAMSEPDLDRYNAKWADACFLFPFNFSGLPAASLPVGETPDGLPIGVQAIGRYGDEATILALATVLEAELRWAERRPRLSK